MGDDARCSGGGGGAGGGGGDDATTWCGGGGGVEVGVGFVAREAARHRARALPPPGEYEERAQAILDAIAELDVDVDAGLSWLASVDDAPLRIVADALRREGR